MAQIDGITLGTFSKPKTATKTQIDGITLGTFSKPKPKTQKKQDLLTTIGKSALAGSNYLGQGILRGFESTVLEPMIQLGTSEINPYYWFNPDKLKTHQQLASELISKDATKELITTLSGDENFNQNFLDKGSVIKSTNLGGQVLQAIGQQLPIIATGNVIGGNVATGLMGYGSGLEESYSEGANRTKANLYGLGSAGIEIGTEMITGGIPGVKTKWLSGLDKLVAKGLGKETLDQASKNIGQALLQAGYKVVGEGGEEAISEMLDPYLKNITYSKDEKINWQNVIESAIIGGITGGILNAPSTIGDVKQSIQTVKNVKSGIQEQAQINKQQKNAISQQNLVNDNTTVNPNINVSSQQVTIENVQQYAVQVDQLQTQLDQMEVQLDNEINVDKQQAIMKSMNIIQNQIDARNEQINSFKSTNPIDNQQYVKSLVPHNIDVAKQTLNRVVQDQIESGQLDAQAQIVPATTEIQKLQTEIAAKFGIQAVFFEGNVNPEEATVGNIVYVNVNPNTSQNVNTADTIHWSLGHGLFHGLKNNYPDIFNEYITHLSTTVDVVQQQNYLDTIRNENYKQFLIENRDVLIEEMVADEFANMFSDKSYWTEISQSNPSLFKRIITAIVEILDQVSGVNFINGLGTEQVQYIRDKFKNETLPLLEKATPTVNESNDVKYTVTSKEVIDDSNIKILKLPKKGESLKLNQVISHPELFEKVPALNDVIISREDSDVENNRYNRSDNTIYITNKINQHKDQTTKISKLLHEIQHAVQHAEGMPGGTNVLLESLKQTFKNPPQALKTLLDNNLDLKQTKYDLGYERYRSNPGEVQARKVESDYLKSVLGNQFKYTDRNKTVVYSDTRLNKIFEEMSQGDTSKGYLTKLSPNQFVDLTAGTISQMKIMSETEPLDIEQLKNEPENIFLQINKKGKVVGHQGRHRMQALQNDGFVSDIPVVVYSLPESSSVSNRQIITNDENNPYQSLKSTTKTLTGQGNVSDYDRAEGKFKVDLVPVNDQNKDFLTQSYSGEGTIKYSDTQKSRFATNSLQKQSLFDPSFLLSDSDIVNYTKTSNEKAVTTAFEDLKTNGVEAVTKWLSKNEASFDDVDIAKGFIAMNQYYKLGDIQQATAIAKKLRNAGTLGGQRIQAFSILQRMTPEGMVYYAQSELTEAWENMNKILDPKLNKWVNDNKDLFVLNKTEVNYINKKMTEFVKLNPESRRAKIIMGEIQSLIKNKIPPEKGNKVKSWARISMLFNPKTLIRNVLGNVSVMPVNAIGDVFGTGLDRALSKATGVRTTGLPSISTQAKGQIRGISEAIDDYRRNIDTRSGDKFEMGLQGKNFKNKYLNKIDKMLTLGLDAGDRGFYEGAYANSLNNQMKLNNVNSPTQNMIEIAREEALQRTWQDKNKFAESAIKLRQLMNNFRVGYSTKEGPNGKLVKIGGYGLGDILIPFALTPANLAKAIYDYSPAAAISVASDAKVFIKAKKMGRMTPQIQKKFVNSFSKATSGTLLYVLGYALAQAGITSGSRDEDKDNASFMKTLGLAPYSIKIGDTSFTYDWAQPVSTPLAIMADIKKMEDDQSLGEGNGVDIGETANSILNAVKLGGSTLYEQSFLQSVATMFGSDGPIEGLFKNVSNLPSRFVPTVLKQVNDLIDPYQRQQYEYNNLLNSSVNSVLSKIPGASQTLSKSKDVMGQDVMKYSGKNSFFNVFFNPSTTYSNTGNDVAQEIKRVYDITGDNSIIPKVAPNSIRYDNKTYTLSTKDKLKYQEITGTTITNTLNDLIKSDAYKQLSNNQRSQVFSETISYATEVAKSKFIKNYNTSNLKNVSQYKDKGLDSGTYMMYKAVISKIESDKGSDGKSIEGSKQGKQAYSIMNMDITDKQKNVMLDLITTSKTPAVVSDLERLNNQQDYINYFSLPASNYFIQSNISRRDYQNAIDFGINQSNFKTYVTTISEIKPNYDKKGNAISGSKKAKVLAYLNSLPLDGYQRILLLSQQGYSVKSYKSVMFSYINNLGVSADRKQQMWEALGFK